MKDSSSPLVAVIGSGPAGLAAVKGLVQAGVRCEVFDDNAQGGGQYFRQLPKGFSVAPDGRVPLDVRAEDLLGYLSHPLARHHARTTVWTLLERLTLAYVGPRESGRLRADAVILAAGAQDRPRPFPGWTLPGVVSAGGCLNLVKGQGMLPGRRVAVAGNGPLVLVAAHTLIKAGAEVVAVVEAAPVTARALAAAPRLLSAPGLLAKGLKYRAAIRRARVPYRESHVVLEARGRNCVEAVTLAPLGSNGAPDQRGAQYFEVDALVTGYGLMPSGEFARMLGCEHRFQSDRGGWLPTRSADLETSVPSVFVVGDAAGIGGAEIALAEGEFVAAVLAARFGGATPSRITSLRKRLSTLERFRRGLEALYRAPANLDLADPDTLICRCEDVTKAELEEVAARAGGDLGRIKMETRVSMGRCQGRNCLSTLSEIASRTAGEPVETIAWPRVRPPVRPVPISALLGEPLGPARSPDLVEMDFSENSRSR